MSVNVEIWANVEGFTGYAVSTHGRVHSSKQKNGRIMSPTIGKNGYLSVLLCRKGEKKRLYVHRLVAMAFIPNPEGKKQVNHKDCSKLNNHVDNLEWMTHQENGQHAWENNLISIDAAWVALLEKRAAQTHCRRGHLFDGIRSSVRYCKTCVKESRARLERNKQGLV